MTNNEHVSNEIIDEPEIESFCSNGIATLTLNRPNSRNALSSGLIASLQIELNRIAEDQNIQVVVIAATGPVFCSGHDLKELRSLKNPDDIKELMSQCSNLMQSIIYLPQPVIAKVHATATAAGCQLVASCDLAIASDTASFATPGVKIGLFCSTPMVALSRCIASKHAMQMLLTGDPIDAETAWRFGLVNEVVSVEKLDRTVATYAEKLCATPTRVVSIGKEAYYQQRELDLKGAYELTSNVMVQNLLMSESDEGISAFLHKQSPRWRNNN